MQVKIAARHGQLSSATQAKITEKAGKLQKYFDRVSEILVTVDLEHRDNHHNAIKVELQVSAEHAEDFVAAEVASAINARPSLLILHDRGRGSEKTILVLSSIS